MKRLLTMGLVILALLKSKVTRAFVWIVIPIALLMLSQQPERARVQGTTFTVKSTADTVDAKPGDGICADNCGNCTLRAAIMEANAFAGDDTINFDPSVFNVPKTITLSIPGVNEDFDVTGDLDITSNLTITGAGANMTTIDAGRIDRVLHVRGASTVYISGLTLTGGKTLNSSPGGGDGGGIRTQGTLLTLTNVTVDGNEADYGGGIEVDGPVTLHNSTVSNNTALAGGGGGIMNYINGPLILNNSTVSGNKGGYGGGIAASNHGNTLFLNNSTVSGNTGEGLNQQAGTVIIKNTILANNGAQNCRFQVQSQISGALISGGHNLSTDNSCSPASIVAPNVSGGLDQAKRDLNNTPAQLAPLALNLPGSTATHALCKGLGVPHASCGAASSPAIDKGGDCLAVDQRGVPRPQGAACDIGAYELGPQKKGMTWFRTASNVTYGTITVGCGSAGPDRCDPAHGDTLCTQQLPVLCIYKPRPALQKPVGLPIPNDYNQWSGGIVATTPPHAGTFKDSAAVNKFCEDVFGKGWRVAEFHDGVYWNFQAYGGTVGAPTIPSTRFWVHINDQKDGNCWSP